MMKWIFFLLLACGLCLADMTRVRLNETADGEGAVCNDGSPGIYYFKAGSKTNSTKWIMHFMGGGFCMNEEECLIRSKARLGSSDSYAPEMGFDWDLPLAEDETINPDFYDWNHVYFIYCDSASWSGNRDEPVIVNGTKIYYRGHRILVSAFKDLLKTKGLDKATDVLLVGDSAGGMAVYFHADEIKKMMPASVKRFKAAPFSGIFLDRPNVEGKVFFIDLFKHIYEMQNCTNNLNARCHLAYPKDGYKCFFAQYSMELTETPIFAINSAYDLVSMRCIVMGEPLLGIAQTGAGNCSAVPGWGECSNLTCTTEQWNKLEEYAQAFRGIVYNSPKLNRDGNGLFIHSCFAHAEEPYDPWWGRYTVEGTVLRDAVRKWFFSDNEPASKHFYEDCDNTQTTSCNPTCYPASSQSSYSSQSSIQSSSRTPSPVSSESAATIIYPMVNIIVAILLAALLF